MNMDVTRQHAATPDRQPPVVEMTGVGKTYAGARPLEALRACDLRIDDGEYVAVMGPSGSGKSTLLNVLGLLDEPTLGEYRLDGEPTAGLPEVERCWLRAYRIGFVFRRSISCRIVQPLKTSRPACSTRSWDAASVATEQLRS